MTKKTAYLLLNFGGPRNLAEIQPFLTELLTDQNVIRTPLPSFLHRKLFTKIAKRRAQKVRNEYLKIGGKSPIFEDTEKVALSMAERLDSPVFTFHRYLPATHTVFLNQITNIECDTIHVFPLFPQFSTTTTGSCARWLQKHLPKVVIDKMCWTWSYADHPAFVKTWEKNIRTFMDSKNIPEKECILLFSAHGIPQKFIKEGDPYLRECQASYNAIIQQFPQTKGILSFQSKFGPGKWLMPSTIDICKNLSKDHNERKYVLFVPLSFTSDHLETLVEIDHHYLPILKKQGLHAHRIPSLITSPGWIQTITTMIKS